MKQLPLAIVHGEAITEAPQALYIPPDALRIMLTNFEGPLELLLFLVRKNKFNILDIPMLSLCRQYAAYVEEILKHDLELSADYLNIAALLVEIKSKMLLPKPPSEEEEEEDPRADLVRRLLEYERIRQAAESLATLKRRERDFISPRLAIELPPAVSKPQLHSTQLAAALAVVLHRRTNQAQTLFITREIISVHEAMSNILRRLKFRLQTTFQKICEPKEGGVTFLALLHLAAGQIVTLRQQEDNTDDIDIELRSDNTP